jgi:hypothetical protein
VRPRTLAAVERTGWGCVVTPPMNKPAKAQVKIDIDAELKSQVETAFQEQGVLFTEGTSRLYRTFVSMPDLRPLLLDQVRGQSRKDLARAILRRLAK